MRTRSSRTAGWTRSDRGQVTIFVALAFAFFLVGFVGFAVDMTNLWFHRQMAQGAADAACQAGVMDLLVRAEGGTVGSAGNFPTSTFDCNGSTYSPCQYASLNGYPAASAGQVSVSFPSSVAGLSGGAIPPTTLAPAPFIRVDIVDSVKMFFAPLITGVNTASVRAQATCAIVVATVPIPIIITNPTCPKTFSSSGSSSITIVGGPPQSIQVNSNNSGAAELGTADLHLGGPTYTGSSFGVFGGPPPTPGGYTGGTTGTWISPRTPISDPFAQLAVPSLPAAPSFAPGCASNPCVVGDGGTGIHAVGAFGCPNTVTTGAATGRGCDLYMPGLYDTPICVGAVPGGGCLGSKNVAIFAPGVYYIRGTKSVGDCPNMPNGACWRPNGQCRYGLLLGSNSIVRPADPSLVSGDGSRGTMFYFTSTGGAGTYGSLYIKSDSGSATAGINNFVTANSICPGGSAPDVNLAIPSTLSGNIFLAPCTGTYGSADGLTRGMLFWNDRDNADLNGQASMQGGGQMLLAGTMYFHNCSSTDGAHLGTNCRQPPNGYNQFFQMQGNPGSATYILGFIVADDMSLGGNAGVKMSIDPNKKFPVLKATMIR